VLVYSSALLWASLHMASYEKPPLVLTYDKFGPDLFPNMYKESDADSQFAFNMYQRKTGQPTGFSAEQAEQLFNPRDMQLPHFRLRVLTKHEKHDKRHSERNVLHITKDDPLQIYLIDRSFSSFEILDTRQVMIKQSRTLLLEVQMADRPYQGGLAVFEYAVEQIGASWCQRYNRPEYTFPKRKSIAEEWDEGLFGFVVVG
jgi:hypothetical protein